MPKTQVRIKYLTEENSVKHFYITKDEATAYPIYLAVIVRFLCPSSRQIFAIGSPLR